MKESLSKLMSRKLVFFTMGLFCIVYLVDKGKIADTVFEACFTALCVGVAGGYAAEYFAKRGS